MSIAGGVPQGYGFFVYDKQKTLTGSIYLGTDNQLRNKNRLENALGITKIEGDTPTDVLWNLLLYKGDPTGQTRWKPLRGSPDRGIELWLAGKRVKWEKFDTSHPAWQGTVKVFQEDYKRLRQENLKVGSTHYKKFLQAASEKYRLPPETLLEGSGLPFEGTEPHTTVITDDFNRADSDSLGLSWIEVQTDIDIVSNEAKAMTSYTGFARWDDALSTDDHYAQIVVKNHYFKNHPGVVIRSDSEAVNFNHYLARSNTFSTRTLQILKVINGAASLIASLVATAGPPQTIKLQALNSDLSAWWSTSRLDVIDTSLTSLFKAGFRNTADSSDVGIRYDNFEAGDLTSPALLRDCFIQDALIQ